MADALAHRGPDDEGYYVDGFLGLGHRRLAVIDPSPAGRQPMISPDRSIAVCFNGTIYNFLELRAALQAKGHRFISQCDTEVLVHGWDEWGQGIVDHLNGHFAFVVWDNRTQQLHLIRDRFGTKPLYFAHLGGLWLFASEIKSILAHPAYSPDLNYDALCEYFTFQNLFRYHTLFKDINLIPAANVFSINARDNSLKREVFWDYDFSNPDPNLSQEEAARETQRLMVQAVRRQLISDVPLGAYLSGGMDSGSIVAIASQEMERMSTFTCGWHMGGVEGVEASFDERVEAELMSYLFKTEHFEQVVGHSDVFWAMPKVVYHLEDLRLGMSYGHYYVARLASKFVKVCLGGTGGDEIFGGYPWRYYRVSSSLGKDKFFANYYDYWQRLVADEERQDFFTSQVWREVSDKDMKDVLKRVFTFHPGMRFNSSEDHISNSLYFEAKTFLAGLLLVGDRLSMAHGLEERMPFLDNDLVEFAQKIPASLKLRNLDDWKRQDENLLKKQKVFYSRFDNGKNILREAMSKFVPTEIRDRHKQGFSSPDESWYRGANLVDVRNLLLDKKSHCQEYISRSAIEQTLQRHCQDGNNLRLRIWSLICFELWLRIFLDGGMAKLRI
jgi:asparagine synthase (glutamine-hydrolysing)